MISADLDVEKNKNQTLLLSFLNRCRQILEDEDIYISKQQMNKTISNATANSLSSTGPAIPTSTSRETYDNAYFYILFVMVFYSVLAMTLFKCFTSSEEEQTDPYEEFAGTGQSSTQTFNTDHVAEKLYYEEESSL